MKVKLLVSRCGPTGSFVAGDVIDVPGDEAKRMLEKGQCEVIRVKAPERAVQRRKSEKATK